MGMTRKQFVTLADDTRTEKLKKAIKAPSKRGYVMGVSIPSKRDIMQELRSDLININRCCVEAGHDPIFHDPDDEPVNLPKKID